MKKRTLSLLLALMMLLPLAACGDGEHTDGESDADSLNVGGTGTGLNEPDTGIPDDGIPRTKTYRILSSEDLTAGKSEGILKYGYNENGQLTYIRYDGETEPILTVTYGADGSIAEIMDGEGGQDIVMRFENGNLVSIVSYLEGGTTLALSKTDITYDSAGRVLSHTEYDIDGNVTDEYKRRYEDDENGRTLAVYDVTDGADAIVTEYKYDEAGNRTEVLHYIGGNSVPDRLYTYEYDENGNVTATAENYVNVGENDEPVYEIYSRTEYTYDGDGNVLTQKYFYYDENGEPTSGGERHYEYSEGRLVSLNSYGMDSKGTSVEIYEYDENGNLSYFKRTDTKNTARTYETKCTWREFSLTEEEIALNEINDAIISEVTYLYRTSGYYN